MSTRIKVSEESFTENIQTANTQSQNIIQNGEEINSISTALDGVWRGDSKEIFVDASANLELSFIEDISELEELTKKLIFAKEEMQKKDNAIGAEIAGKK